MDIFGTAIYPVCMLLFAAIGRVSSEQRLEGQIYPAMQYYRMENYEKALNEVNCFIDKYPYEGKGYLLKAKIHDKLNQGKEAVKALESCVCMKNEILEARMMLGEYYSQLGNEEAARYQFKVARQISKYRVGRIM